MPTQTTFRQAADFILPFGAYSGKSIDDVAAEDEGLRYLDHLFARLDVERRTRKWLSKSAYFTLRALEVYLGDATIAKDLDRLLALAR